MRTTVPLCSMLVTSSFANPNTASELIETSSLAYVLSAKELHLPRFR